MHFPTQRQRRSRKAARAPRGGHCHHCRTRYTSVHTLHSALAQCPMGFKGGLTPRAYIAITGVSLSTATRDLADMVRKGALVRTGKRRLARYLVNVPQRLHAE